MVAFQKSTTKLTLPQIFREPKFIHLQDNCVMLSKAKKPKANQNKKQPTSSSYFIIAINATASHSRTIQSIQKTQILYLALHSLSMPALFQIHSMKHSNWMLWGTLPGMNQSNSPQPRRQQSYYQTTLTYYISLTPSMPPKPLSTWVASEQQHSNISWPSRDVP